MKLASIKPEYVMGGAVLLAIAYMWARGAKGVGADIGGAVVDMASGIVSGTANAADQVLSGAVIGAGKAVGLPATSVDACTASIQEFRAAPWWKQAYLSFNVSAQCSAGDYLRFVGTGKAPNEP